MILDIEDTIDYLKIIASIIVGITAGYTLTPVPKVFDNFLLTDAGLIFKFLILNGAGLMVLGLHNATIYKMIFIAICSGLLLYIFRLMREYDKKNY